MDYSISREWVRSGQRWYHPKTKGYYKSVGIAEQSTNNRPKEEFVIYWSERYAGMRIRLIEEFLDGRFLPCHANGKVLQFVEEASNGRSSAIVP